MVAEGYKQTEVGVIPEDWLLKKVLSVVSSIQSGSSALSHKGSYPLYGSTGVIGNSQTCDYRGVSILVARVGANAGQIYTVDGEYGVSDNTIIIKCNESISQSFLELSLKKEKAKLTDLWFRATFDNRFFD